MDPHEGKLGSRRALPSIRTRLALVVLACLLPTVVGFALLINHFYDREHIQFNRDTILTARALVLAADRDLNSGKIAALSLASSPHIATNNLAAFHAQAKSLLSDAFPGFTFVLSDQKGQQLVNTMRPFGQPLPLHGNPGQLRSVFETGTPNISDVYIGGVLRRPLISIDVPVWRDGRIVYCLSVGILPERLGKILTEQQLPADRIVAMFDTKGVIVARTHEPEKFTGQKGAPLLLERIRATNEEEVNVVSVEGIPVHFNFSRSPSSGWTVAIGVPRSTLFSELLHSIVWISLALVTLLIAGVALAWHFGGAISRSVKALASPLLSSPAEEQAPSPPISFKEANEVAAELVRHRHHLESLVEERTGQLEKSKARLADNERFMRAVTDNLPVLVTYWTAELRCKFANKQALEWFGRTQNEMVGMSIQDVLGAELFALNEPLIRRALQGEQQGFERLMTNASGAIRNKWVNYIPDFDAGGTVAGFFVHVSDITALKQAEESLRISATAFDSNEAIMITDPNAVILQVNRAFTATTGYTADEIVGLNPLILKSDRHDAAFYAAMWDSINRTGSWQGEIWDRRKNGEIFPAWMTITGVKGDDDTISHYVYSLTDITLRKIAEGAIEQLAFFDVLTGLPNRRLLMDRLRRALAASDRSGLGGALMFLDLDHFKTLNDTLGHDSGDMLLKQVAERLAVCVREDDTVARLGGDEFVVLLENLSEHPEKAATQAEGIGETILSVLNMPYDLAGHQYHSTPSIGVTLFTDMNNSGIPGLLKRADQAMYQAKAAGRNAMRFFDEKLQDAVTAHNALEAEFRLGLARQEFTLHFQAQVNNVGQVNGVEALVRWRHPQRGLLAPAEFIPLAEETGLILPLDRWVLETACAQLAAWATTSETAKLTMAVNVSAIEFHSHDYVEQVVAILAQSKADPHQLKLEITESSLVSDIDDIIIKMTALHAHGVRFALDDFGTGYSSLSYLKRLPLDQLKIDKSFVHDVLTDDNDAAITRTIIALGQTLGLAVIAEGVETEEQRIFLAHHNCNAYQGYLFSRPLPLLEFEQYIRRELLAAD